MWIAAIQRERVELKDGTIDDRDAICRSIIAEAVKGQLEIATSTLSLVEVCKIETDAVDGDRDLLFDFFRHQWVLMVALDTQVGHIGRALMGAGHLGLKPNDATHLASALVAGATEFQTFDGRLLDLDGKIAKPEGGTLAIRRPTMQGQIGLFDTGVYAPTPAAPLPSFISALPRSSSSPADDTAPPLSLPPPSDA